MFLILFLHLLIILIGGYFIAPEFTLYPYLTSHGFTPYLNLIDQHLPVIFFGPLSLPSWLAQNRNALLAIFISILLFTDYLFYLSIKNNSSNPKLLTFSFVVFSWFFGGNFFWLSTFITFFLALILYLRRYKNKTTNFIIGFLLGLILLTKPTFLPTLILMIFVFQLVNIFTLLGLTAPLFITILYLYKLDLFSHFYDLVIRFNGQYYVALAKTFPNKKQLLLLTLAFGPTLYLLFKKNLKFLVISLLFLALAYPRFEYLHLGPFILFVAYSISKIKPSQGWSLVLILTTSLFVSLSLVKLNNFRYGDFYFNEEVIKTSKMVENLPGENVLILGGNELIYSLSGKTPPSVYLPPLPWYFAVPEYQQQLINSIISSRTPILYYRNASVDGVPISRYTGFLNEVLQVGYNQSTQADYYLYLPK